MCTLTVLPNLLDPGKHVEYLFHAVSNIKPLKVVSQHNTLFFYCISGKPKVGEVIKNVQCGYDVRRKDYVSPLYYTIRLHCFERIFLMGNAARRLDSGHL